MVTMKDAQHSGIPYQEKFMARDVFNPDIPHQEMFTARFA